MRTESFILTGQIAAKTAENVVSSGLPTSAVLKPPASIDIAPTESYFAQPKPSSVKGPLTTTFSPPFNCASLSLHYVSGTERGRPVITSKIWRNFPADASKSWTSCYPSCFAQPNGIYYSPGLCPRSWSATEFGYFQATTTNQPTRTAMCCPTGYNLREDVQGSLNFSCQSNIEMDVLATILNPTRLGMSTTLISDGTAYALPVQVRWSPNDTINPLLEIKSLNYKGASFRQTYYDSDGNVWVAVAVIVPIICSWMLFLLILKCCSIRRRRNRERIEEAVAEALRVKAEEDTQKSKSDIQGSSPSNSYGKAELADTRKPMEEMPEDTIYELPTTTERHEINTRRPQAPLEMQGSQVGIPEMEALGVQNSSEKLNEHSQVTQPFKDKPTVADYIVHAAARDVEVELEKSAKPPVS